MTKLWYMIYDILSAHLLTRQTFLISSGPRYWNMILSSSISNCAIFVRWRFRVMLCILCSVLVILNCVAAEGWAAPSSLYPFVWCREGRGRWEEIHNKDQIKCLSDATENIWLSYWSEARGVGRQFHLWVHQPAGHPRQHRSSVILKYILSCRKVFHYSFGIYLYSFLRML